jgi:hypothetical protein
LFLAGVNAIFTIIGDFDRFSAKKLFSLNPMSWLFSVLSHHFRQFLAKFLKKHNIGPWPHRL